MRSCDLRSQARPTRETPWRRHHLIGRSRSLFRCGLSPGLLGVGLARAVQGRPRSSKGRRQELAPRPSSSAIAPRWWRPSSGCPGKPCTLNDVQMIYAILARHEPRDSALRDRRGALPRGGVCARELPVPPAECVDLSARQAGTVGWGTPLGVQPRGFTTCFSRRVPRWARCTIRRESERRSSARDLRLRLHGCVRRRTVHFRPPVMAEHDRPERTAAHRPHRGARVAPTDRVPRGHSANL